MNTLHQSFSVRFTYDVFFTERLFDHTNSLLWDFFKTGSTAHTNKKILFIVDDGVVRQFPNLPDQIRTYFTAARQEEPGSSASRNTAPGVAELLVIPGGEAAKNAPSLVGKLIDAIDQYGIDRHSYVVGVGGGSVLDLVGFAAAVAHRGIRHIRIPTTVLSQNDSGIGVKNGVNYKGKKNFLGTFAPPVAVFNDFDFLTTLDIRDWRAGMAEAIKVALIKDPAFFDFLEANAEKLAARDMDAMQYLVHRCADLHLQHIAGGDPFEQGSSRPLDFGHWSAHKLEQLTHFELRHGEAVAIGMAIDCIYANQIGLLPDQSLDRVLGVLHTLGFSLYHPALDADDSVGILKGLSEFREHLGGRLTILLLKAVGEGVEVHNIDADGIRRAIATLKEREELPV